jgi:N-acetylneuraminic acid mutarotase
MLILVRQGQSVLGKPQNLEPENQRWATIATLPTARRGLAVTAVGNWIYAIGGETESGIVGRVERFDPITKSWEQLADKPLPVTDIEAAVVGGLIFVPGGRLAEGEITSAVEVFDPRSGTWWNVAPLPKALSAYACVAFEGKLYTFGGWDGQNYVDTVFSYDPQRNIWTEGTAMEFPAGLAAAEVSGDAIFIMGGVNNSGILDINYAYFPQYEFTDDPAWVEKSPMPEGRYAFGMIGVADILHVLGGIGTEGNPSPYKYFPHEDTWQIFKHPDGQSWSYFDGTAIETQLFFLGGQIDNKISNISLTYKAIFTISLPIVK